MTDQLTELEIDKLRAFLNRPVPAAAPPIVIGPFPNVPAPGSPIRSDWTQTISTYVANNLGVYANAAALAAAAPPDGALGMQVDTGVVFLRFGGNWQPLAAMGSQVLRGGQVAGTAQTGIAAANRTVATLGLGSAPYARFIMADGWCRLGQESAATATFRLDLNLGASSFFGDENNHGAAVVGLNYHTSAVFLVPAATPATVTMTAIRIAGTATGASTADARYNRLHAIAIAAP